MHERDKLAEAEHFLCRMRAEVAQRRAFRHELSAFLSASRSVLQYALKEAKGKDGGQGWHDEHMAADAVFGFLKCKRNLNVHSEPIVPPLDMSLSLPERVAIGESVVLVLFDRHGKAVEKRTGDLLPPVQEDRAEDGAATNTVTYRYTFPDWSGGEDVLSLCEIYLSKLRSLVDDGVAKGYISG